MRQIDKNTVEAKNQVKKDDYVTYINGKGKGIRIAFIGNSITRHGVKEDIGWFTECGMAASAEEKDYVHIVVNEILKYYADAAFCVCNVCDWEREFKNGKSTYHLYAAAKNFDADIIIARMIENCPRENFDEKLFKNEYADFISYLSNEHRAKVIVTSSFWKHDGDESLREYAKENNYPFIYLGDLGEDKSMKAFDRFEHEGVAQHPGDKGMQVIAGRIIAELKKILF